MLREEEEGDPRASRRASSAHAPRSRPALREMIRSSVVLSSPALQLMHALTVSFVVVCSRGLLLLLQVWCG